MWGIKRLARLRLLLADCGGESMIGFGFVLPLLLLVSFGAAEMALVAFDFHRAGEATRRAARIAVIADPVIDVDGFTAGAYPPVPAAAPVSPAPAWPLRRRPPSPRLSPICNR